jgi:gamma-glutamyltranspeptidase/glutathione hydrolase
MAASKRPTKAKNGMVVSAEPNASKSGVEILKAGGNAVDAAVAVGFTLAVTYPQAGNIGGGGFMVIRMADGRTTTIDYREKAPAAAHRDMYLNEKGDFVPERSQEGYLSCGVPGSVAGMLLALEKFGTMKRAAVINSAIHFASKGVPVSESQGNVYRGDSVQFAKYPSTKKVFLRLARSYREGDILVQTDLAKTLQKIRDKGRNGFYKGKIAELIVAEMKRGGGIITTADLEQYQAIERRPVVGNYRGYEIVSMGPPSSGGVALIQLLNLLEGFNIAESGFSSSKTLSLMAEAMKLVYADRAEFLGDADFYAIPVDELTSKRYAEERRKLIRENEATPSATIYNGKIPPKEGMHTTHYSVIDRWGNAVSVTTTINSGFGSGVVVDGAGFFLNNEMDDFSAKPGVPNQFGLLGKEANAIQPNKRMLSAMTPTIVVKNGQPCLIVGSPGGSTIITAVLQVILNVVDHKMNVQQAVDAPRMHHQWRPDTLFVEPRFFPKDVIENLTKRGYTVLDRWGNLGRIEAIVIDQKTGVCYGATDPRGDGLAAGY